jgi:hypothetical protein
VLDRYWTKVMHTSLFLLNSSPTRGVIEDNPEEVWFRKKPNIIHSKIFGSVAYDGATNRKLLIVGYSDQAKAYRLLDLYTNQVVLSMDVRIDESSDLNQVNGHWFEAEKSGDVQGRQVQNVGHSSCDIVEVAHNVGDVMNA